MMASQQVNVVHLSSLIVDEYRRDLLKPVSSPSPSTSSTTSPLSTLGFSIHRSEELGYSNYSGFHVEFSREEGTYRIVDDSTTLSVIDLLWRDLRDAGFIELALPTAVTESIVELEELATRHLCSLPVENKNAIAKAFTKAVFWMKTNFSYAYLKAPGKETWKIRALNTNERVMIEAFDGLEALLRAAFRVIVSMHSLSLALFAQLDRVLPESSRGHLVKVVEDLFTTNGEMAFSYGSTFFYGSPSHHLIVPQRHINILRYFDPSKQMPVNEHTDAYLFTVIPLNTASPALEVYDLRKNSWYCPEEQPSVKRYSRAVVMIGESLSQLTNDTFVPTLHRVEESRFSVPFFLSSRRGAVLDPRSSSAAVLEPFGRELLVVRSDIKENESQDKNLLETGLFLWEQTKRANATPGTLASTLKRRGAALKNRLDQ